MSVRAQQYDARVLRREQLSEHLVRIVLGGLDGFESTQIPDEWVGLVVPGQFQSRYYTVRHWDGAEMTLDIVVHEVGLVTEWASRHDIVGEVVRISEPKGSFAPPDDAWWLYLVGDLTAAPAMARIAESIDPAINVMVWVEAPEPVEGYFAEALAGQGNLVWLRPAAEGSGLARWVESLPWPDGPGYFWMAGESAQMRAIRKHLMREVKLPTAYYDVMGYWRASTGRQPRAVDPGPIYRAGKAAGKSDAEIWADYDQAQQAAQQ
ncbi:siderophore-interacting protein [Nocardioides sp.]|uniref:siderophore-interacting protein n=1 Tax=Nocardioides sp. TaxID=35761 RepID=UPI0039E2A1B7